MPKKISKIILHAKHRLSGRKSRPKPSESLESKTLIRTTTSDSSSRLLQGYSYDDAEMEASASVGAADYDDFESPDLNLQSLKQVKKQTASTPEIEQSSNQQSESIQGQPKKILQSLLSFGRSVDATSGYNELYTEQKDLNQKHWWQSDFLLGNESHGPVLFGTWNGVFITTVVHLFGVISFLRIGWMVGNEGVPLSMSIVFGCFLFNTISLWAAIGIMERCAAATTAGSGPFQQNIGPGSLPAGGYRFDPEYPHTTASARANVHILIATVLGSRIGGAISLVYCIGQAVSCALHVTGFSETFVHLCAVLIERQLVTSPNNTIWIHSGTISSSQVSLARTMARLMRIEIESVPSTTSVSDEHSLQLILTPETFQIVSSVLIFLLFIFNIVGIRWLFRLQTLLFLALVAAVGDFTAGLFKQHPDFGYGEIKVSKKHFFENIYPNLPVDLFKWPFWHQLFQTIGIFFPATIGVMAGVNMSSDLERPTKSIPVGSFGAILSSYAVHVLFIFGLALSCTRMSLLNDYTIAQHVSAVGIFFAFGLYMSTISSSLGSMYTAPRILQNLAQELHSVPVVRCFARGRGPNNIPINALILFTLLTMGFIMIGGINVLAPIVTIPYLLTYATIEYAYFSMAMTFDIQIQREKRFMQIAIQLKSSDSTNDLGPSPSTKMMLESVERRQMEAKTPTTPTLTRQQQAEDTVSLSASLGGGGDGGTLSQSPSLQQQHLAGYGSIQSITQHIKIKRRQSTQSSESDGENESSKSKLKSKSSGTLDQTKPATKKSKPKTIRQLMAAVSISDDELSQDDEVIVKDEDEINQRADRMFGSVFDREETKTTPKIENVDEGMLSDLEQQPTYRQQSERLLMPDPGLAEIGCKQEVWYLRLMNRWIVLISAILKIILMFIIAWHYSLITIAMFILFSSIIGRTNPGFYPGVSEFLLCNWIRNCWSRIKFWRPNGYPKVLNSSNSQTNLVASYSYDRIVLPETAMPDFHCESDQLTKENSDYIERPPCHYTTTINPQLN